MEFIVSYFSDLDRTFAVMDLFRRRMDRAFDDGFTPHALRAAFEEPRGLTGPRFTLRDTGPTLVLRAELPGLSEKDLDISIHQDVLSVKGERKAETLEGYHVHRKERASQKFARTYTLPTKVDMERCAAVMKDGVLTITLTKAVDAQPRQITVKAS
jgi:HSP20 family protein